MAEIALWVALMAVLRLAMAVLSTKNALVRSRDGSVVLPVGDRLVRLYEWVDLLEVDRGLDPGMAVHAIERRPSRVRMRRPFDCRPLEPE